MQLDKKVRYLQIAFNSTASLSSLSVIPKDPRILIEAGTPLIKQMGEMAIRQIRNAWSGYLVADLKVVDGAAAEVYEACRAGANAVTVMGSSPIETINVHIEECRKNGVHSFVDMMNVKDPIRVLRKLKKQPNVVILHRGRDEENTYGKIIEYRHIRRIKSKYDVFISTAGGVDLKEAQRAAFNGSNIVVVNLVGSGDKWKGIRYGEDISQLAQKFLKTID